MSKIVCLKLAISFTCSLASSSRKLQKNDKIHSFLAHFSSHFIIQKPLRQILITNYKNNYVLNQHNNYEYKHLLKNRKYNISLDTQFKKFDNTY